MTIRDGALGTQWAASSGLVPDAMANRVGVKRLKALPSLLEA
jgi:hypothetical protein